MFSCSLPVNKFLATWIVIFVLAHSASMAEPKDNGLDHASSARLKKENFDAKHHDGGENNQLELNSELSQNLGGFVIIHPGQDGEKDQVNDLDVVEWHLSHISQTLAAILMCVLAPVILLACCVCLYCFQVASFMSMVQRTAKVRNQCLCCFQDPNSQTQTSPSDSSTCGFKPKTRSLQATTTEQK